jgi:integrase
MSSKRAYGSGSTFAVHGSWYGKWRLGDRQVKRKLGPIRAPGTREGMTRTQAEAELRRLIAEVTVVAPAERLTFSEVAERYLDHLEKVVGRKQDYRIMLRRHFAAGLGDKAIARIRVLDIANYIAAARASGLPVKTVTNHLNFAHGVFGFAVKRGWAISNPVAAADRPRAAPVDPDIRFLDREELEALLWAAARDDVLGPTDAALFLTAATTGLRQGELAALRWRDVDWSAGVVRVRRSYSRGEWGTPKSRRSSRAVPLPDRTAAELDRHYQRSAYRADDDLAFCHPQSGGPYDASRMRNRFYEAMAAAGMADRCGATEASRSTRCGIPSAPGWPPSEFRCARSRNGWATATSRRPWSTPISPPIRLAEPRSRSSRLAERQRPFQVLTVLGFITRKLDKIPSAS